MNLEVKQTEPDDLPLVVDLDGTLIRTDLLVELFFAHLGSNPLRIFSLWPSFSRGKACLKADIARDTPIEPRASALQQAGFVARPRSPRTRTACLSCICKQRALRGGRG